MDGLLRSVGDGITGLFAGTIGAMEAAVRGAFGQVQALLPGPLLFIVAFVVLAGAAWVLAKR